MKPFSVRRWWWCDVIYVNVNLWYDDGARQEQEQKNNTEHVTLFLEIVSLFEGLCLSYFTFPVQLFASFKLHIEYIVNAHHIDLSRYTTRHDHDKIKQQFFILINYWLHTFFLNIKYVLLFSYYYLQTSL